MHAINLRLVAEGDLDADTLLHTLSQEFPEEILGGTELERDRFHRLEPTIPHIYTKDRVMQPEVLGLLTRGNPMPPTQRQSPE